MQIVTCAIVRSPMTTKSTDDATDDDNRMHNNPFVFKINEFRFVEKCSVVRAETLKKG